MPGSDPALRPWIASTLRILAVQPKTIIDVGAGAGTWHAYLRHLYRGATWTAIEIWEPYVSRFGLKTRYNDVIVADVRELDPLPDADLWIFGDVLEHMPDTDAVAVWDRARRVARWLVINMPVLDYPQGEVDGNPHEAHLYQWNTREVLARFGGIVAHAEPMPGSTVGAFIARGTRSLAAEPPRQGACR